MYLIFVRLSYDKQIRSKTKMNSHFSTRYEECFRGLSLVTIIVPNTYDSQGAFGQWVRLSTHA